MRCRVLLFIGLLAILVSIGSISASALQVNISYFAVDNAEDVWRSNNSGVSWTAINTSFSGNSNDATVMSINSSNTVFLIDDAQDVYVSSSQGKNWKRIASNLNGVPANILAFTIDDNNTLFAIDANEDVWKSMNSGFSWSRVSSNFNGGSLSVAGLVSNDSLALYAADNSQDIWRSTNAGVSWTAINTSFNGNTNNPAVMGINASNTLLIIDDTEDVYVSDNQGISWKRISIDYNGGGPNAMKLLVDTNNTFTVIDAAEDVWQSINGGFIWARVATNLNGANGAIDAAISMTNTYDLSAPTFTNPAVSPPNNTAYAKDGVYTFNVTVSDETLVSTVILNLNGVNYTASNVSSTYTVTRTDLAAGTYTYTWFANDTSGNLNQTAQQSYTVSTANSSLLLELNSQQNNLTVISGTIVNITGTILVGVGNITLYVNNALVANSSSPITKLYNFNGTGLQRVHVNYSSTQNFTSSSSEFFVNVTPSDTAPPVFTNESLSPVNGSFYTKDQQYLFNMSITDNIAVNSTLINFNGVNYSTTQLGSVYTFRRTDLAAGTYTYTWFANDTSGNLNQTTTQTYVVARKPTTTTLELNSQRNNISVTTSSTVTILATLISETGNVSIILDTTVLQEGNSPLSTTYQFTTNGLFKVTANYSGQQNLTQSSEEFFVTVSDSSSSGSGGESGSSSSDNTGSSGTEAAKENPGEAISQTEVPSEPEEPAQQQESQSQQQEEGPPEATPSFLTGSAVRDLRGSTNPFKIMTGLAFFVIESVGFKLIGYILLIAIVLMIGKNLKRKLYNYIHHHSERRRMTDELATERKSEVLKTLRKTFPAQQLSVIKEPPKEEQLVKKRELPKTISAQELRKLFPETLGKARTGSVKDFTVSTRLKKPEEESDKPIVPKAKVNKYSNKKDVINKLKEAYKLG